MNKKSSSAYDLKSATHDKPLRVLLIDDEADSLLPVLAQKLERFSISLSKETSAKQAVKAIATNEPDIVLLDLHFPGDDIHEEGTTGGRLLPEIRQRFPELAVIVFTTRLDDMDIPLETFGERPHGYFAKPDFSDKQWPGMLVTAMHAAVDNVKLLGCSSNNQESFLAGPSLAMREVTSRIHSAARNGLNVLIIGDLGTGKALVAEAIHNLSKRTGSFLQLDCAEETDVDILESQLFGHAESGINGIGAFEEAAKGTLFLTGLDCLPLPLQDRLSRVLHTARVRRKDSTEEIEVDVRVIAASGHGLSDLVADGVLREALAYQLAQVLIPMPPLRQRLEDIPDLFRIGVAQANKRLNRMVSDALRPEVRAELEAHTWYGNLREFDSAILRAVANTTSNILLPEDFEFVSFGKRTERGQFSSDVVSSGLEQNQQIGSQENLTHGLTDRLEALTLEQRYSFLLDLAQDVQTEVLIEFIGRLRNRTGKKITHKALAAELDPLKKGESDFDKVRQFVCGRVKLTQLDVNQ